MNLALFMLTLSALLNWIVVIIASFILGKEHNNMTILTVALINMMLSIIVIISETEDPVAMDVYKGLTTLEITYRDGTPVDSVVVWKEVSK